MRTAVRETPTLTHTYRNHQASSSSVSKLVPSRGAPAFLRAHQYRIPPPDDRGFVSELGHGVQDREHIGLESLVAFRVVVVVSPEVYDEDVRRPRLVVVAHSLIKPTNRRHHPHLAVRTNACAGSSKRAVLAQPNATTRSGLCARAPAARKPPTSLEYDKHIISGRRSNTSPAIRAEVKSQAGRHGRLRCPSLVKRSSSWWLSSPPCCSRFKALL